MTEWDRDLPALEKIKAEEAADRIDAYIERIQADIKRREIELAQRLAQRKAELDAKLAELRATREQRIAENIAAANAKIFADIK